MKRLALGIMWLLAFLTAVAAARYFFGSPLLIDPLRSFDSAAGNAGANIAPNLYRYHRVVFLSHVGAGIVALLVGPFQFISKLRDARPKFHRRLGITYLAAVAIGAGAGLPLSFLILESVPPLLRFYFLPMAGSFLVLAIAWALTSAIAFYRARQRRFREHRAWMTRSYSLTFAAVTVRLVSALLLVATGDVVFAVNSGVLSWPLNLLAAEWLVRRESSAPLAEVVA